MKMNFDTFLDLDSAEISSKEYNPLGYDPTDYPSIDEMLFSPQFNSNDTNTINLLELGRNGVFIQEDMQNYLDKKSNSSSALKEALVTPYHYYFYKNLKQKAPDKKHFALGTFAHMAFLEPHLFDKVIIQPDHPLNSLDGIKKMINWFEKINKEPQLSTDELKMQDLRAYLDELRQRCTYQTIAKDDQVIVDAIKQNYHSYGTGIIKRILKGAVAETSVYYNDPVTNLPLKIRPDYFNIKENIGVNAVISFKTTSAISLGKMLYDSAKYKYELSEGMYLEGLSHVTGRTFNVTIMIMLQTIPPYLPVVFWWAPQDLQNGKYKFRYALDTVKECYDKKRFPGFESAAESGHSGIIAMEQPDWAAKILHPVDIDD